MPRHHCLLELPNGPARRVGEAGLVIGRQHDCDIVATHASVSRRHALVRPAGDGFEAVPLGQAGIKVNGKMHNRIIAISDGDELEVPGLVLRVRLAAGEEDTPRPAAGYHLETGGGSFGVSRSPFVVGGDPKAHLVMKGWPDEALRFHLAQGELYVEVVVGTARKNKQALAAEETEVLEVGDIVEYRKEKLKVSYAAGDALSTVHGTVEEDLPTRAVIEMLPRGGRVVFTVRDGEHPVFLADRRLDLIIALLRPPEEYKAGEFIPDDVIRTIVWPRNPGVTRPEINMLISRCRRDLVTAGLAGARLLERAQGGGATRLVIAPGADVILR